MSYMYTYMIYKFGVFPICIFFFFWPNRVTCRILVLCIVRARSLNQWTTREVLVYFICILYVFYMYFNTTLTLYIYLYIWYCFILHTYIVDVVHVKTHSNEFWGEREENWTGKRNREDVNCIYKDLFLSKVTWSKYDKIWVFIWTMY